MDDDDVDTMIEILLNGTSNTERQRKALRTILRNIQNTETEDTPDEDF